MARLAGFAPSVSEVPILHLQLVLTKMARLAGFEPANDGTKTRCLTTWRQPNAIIILPQWSATVKTCKNPKQVV